MNGYTRIRNQAAGLVGDATLIEAGVSADVREDIIETDVEAARQNVDQPAVLSDLTVYLAQAGAAYRAILEDAGQTSFY